MRLLCLGPPALQCAAEPSSQTSPLKISACAPSLPFAVVSTVERVTPPARVSASLERMTAGYDPDRHMVIQTRAGGLVVQDDAAPTASSKGKAGEGETAKDK